MGLPAVGCLRSAVEWLGPGRLAPVLDSSRAHASLPKGKIMSKKFFIAWIVIFVAWFAGSFVVHGQLLHDAIPS